MWVPVVIKASGVLRSKGQSQQRKEGGGDGPLIILIGARGGKEIGKHVEERTAIANKA